MIRGRLIHGLEQVHHSRDAGVEFATPAIDPDALVWSRREPLPMLDTRTMGGMTSLRVRILGTAEGRETA